MVPSQLKNRVGFICPGICWINKKNNCSKNHACEWLSRLRHQSQYWHLHHGVTQSHYFTTVFPSSNHMVHNPINIPLNHYNWHAACQTMLFSVVFFFTCRSSVDPIGTPHIKRIKQLFFLCFTCRTCSSPAEPSCTQHAPTSLKKILKPYATKSANASPFQVKCIKSLQR